MLILPASRLNIKVEEVIIDPRAPRSVRLGWFDSSSSKRSAPSDQSNRSPSNERDYSSSNESPPTYWIFRATLSDGSQFAIDPCNAQYSFTTQQDRIRGVFPWNSYLGRLMVPSDAPLDAHELTFHKPKGKVHPAGTLEEGRSNLFADQDIRSTAESCTATKLFATARDLAITHDLLLVDIMDRSSNRQVYESQARVFTERLELVFKKRRDTGIKTTLLQRLEVKAGVRQRLDFAHWLR